MVRLLYFETGVGGHRSDHLKAVLDASVDRSRWVVAAHAELIDQLGDEWAGLLDNRCSGGPVWISLLEGQREESLSGRQLWLLARDVARQNGSHRVFIPHLDPVIPATFHLRQDSEVSISGTYFRPPVHYSGALSVGERAKLAIKSAMFRHFARRRDVRAILSLDRFFPKTITASSAAKSKIQFLPDLVPITDEQIALAKSAAAAKCGNRTRFLLFGALYRRKGLFETLDAISLLPPEIARSCEFSFCGQLPDESAAARSVVRDLSAQTAATISLVDRFLTTEKLAMEVASADVILAPYINHKGSSGTLYWAAAFEKPVIAQDYGLVGREVREFDLGLTVEVGVPQALAAAIERFVRGAVSGRDAEKVRTFHQGHTRTEFGTRIEQAMTGG